MSFYWPGFRYLASVVHLVWHEDHPPTAIAGLNVLDIRPDRHLDHDQVRATFEEAVAHLATAGPDFLDMVRTNITQVTVYDLPDESVVWWSRDLNTPLPARLRRSTFYLACRLVWTGAYFQALSTVPFAFRFWAQRAARKVADESWLDFVRRFPDTEEWEAYLKAHR